MMQPNPSSADVIQLLNAGRLREASTVSSALIIESPGVGSHWHAASCVATAAGNPQRAREAIFRALALEPNNPVFGAWHARCLLLLDLKAEAFVQAESVLLQKQIPVDALDLLGSVFEATGKSERALEMYQLASKREPQNPHFLFNAALILRNLGLLLEAEEIYNKVIALAPKEWEAYKNRSDLRVQSNISNHIAELSAQLQHWKENQQGRVILAAALAKELEDIGDYAASFRYLQLSMTTRRSNMRYEVETDIETMELIQEVFNVDYMAQEHPGCEKNSPIFILGLPRTGSTLTERILSSLPGVVSAGERPDFQIQLTRLAQQQQGGSKFSKEGLVRLSSTLDFRKLGQAYIESTKMAAEDFAFFIDKMPQNFLYIGLIALALPNAKIVHVTRHPYDTCYAIYKTQFKRAYPYSYDLKELGRYYLAYRKLMAHWHNVLPGRVIDVAYEDIVDDIEGTSQILCDHCELDWSPQCLRFYQNQAASNTASASQVRSPIYNSSVQRWRHYKDELKPMIDVLKKGGLNVQEVQPFAG